MKPSATVAALPLPETVLFPGVYVVLHASETWTLRQLELGRRQGGYVSTVLPTGAGTLADGPIHPVGCLAEIQEVQRSGPGWNFRLLGLARLELRLEFQTAAGRLVQGQLLDDPAEPGEPELERIASVLDGIPGLPAAVRQIRTSVPGSRWLDSVSFYLPVDALDKQELLAEGRAPERARRILQLLGGLDRELCQAAPRPSN